MIQSLLDADHPDVAITRTGLAVMLVKTDRGEEALEPARLAIEPLDAAYGSDHWRSLWARATLGAALVSIDSYDEAETLLTESYEGLRQSPGARRFHIETVRGQLADLYRLTDRPGEAARLDGA